MLHEFMVFIEQKMREKGEEFNADHMLELLAMVEGQSQEEGMATVQAEAERLAAAMKTEMSEVGFSALHGELWTKRLNAEQAVRGGNGELFFNNHDPREAS